MPKKIGFTRIQGKHPLLIFFLSHLPPSRNPTSIVPELFIRDQQVAPLPHSCLGDLGDDLGEIPFCSQL